MMMMILIEPDELHRVVNNSVAQGMRVGKRVDRMQSRDVGKWTQIGGQRRKKWEIEI